MNKAAIFGATAITATIFGSLATAAISVINTEYEPLFGLWFIFGLGFFTIVVACLFTGIEDEDRFFTVNRLFVLLTALVFTAIPYLLWVHRIVYFS